MQCRVMSARSECPLCVPDARYWCARDHRSDAEAPEDSPVPDRGCLSRICRARQWHRCAEWSARNTCVRRDSCPSRRSPSRRDDAKHGSEPHGLHESGIKRTAHLLGYTHGQEIVLQEDMLCVPIVNAGPQRWTAVGPQGAPKVTVESFQGALKSGSRVNTAFALTIRQGDAPVEQAQVRLLARMPHHDRHMPGGHGPANDPDVQGIMAQPVGQGRYTIPTVDFTMDGPWLFEVQYTTKVLRRTKPILPPTSARSKAACGSVRLPGLSCLRW